MWLGAMTRIPQWRSHSSVPKGAAGRYCSSSGDISSLFVAVRNGLPCACPTGCCLLPDTSKWTPVARSNVVLAGCVFSLSAAAAGQVRKRQFVTTARHQEVLSENSTSIWKPQRESRPALIPITPNDPSALSSSRVPRYRGGQFDTSTRRVHCTRDHVK